MQVWQCFRPVTDPSMSSLISFYHCVSEWAVVGGISCFLGPVFPGADMWGRGGVSIQRQIHQCPR